MLNTSFGPYRRVSWIRILTSNKIQVGKQGLKQLHKAGPVPALLFYERVLALKPGKGFFHTFIEKKYFPLESVVAVALDHLRQKSR